MFFGKRFVVLQIAVPPEWKYKSGVEVCLGFLFSDEFGCNYDFFFFEQGEGIEVSASCLFSCK